MQALDALANANRRAILEHLRRSPATVGDIADAFPISRPAVSRHLALLEGAGLVGHETHGRHNVYAVRPEGFESLRAYLEQFWDDALPRFRLVAENLESP